MDVESICIRLRWDDGPICPRCDGDAASELPRRALRRWRCRRCRLDFTVTAGTPLHSTKVGLAKWAQAAHSARSTPSDVKGLIGVSYPTARRIARVLELSEMPPGEGRLRRLLEMPRDAESVINDRLPLHLDAADNPISSMTDGERLVMQILRALYRGATLSRIVEESRLSRAHVLRCLESLERRGYITHKTTRVSLGYSSIQTAVWSLADTQECMDAIAYLPWRPLSPENRTDRIPREFWWVFWSGTSAGDLDLADERDALFAADSMIGGPDALARHWGLQYLPLGALKNLTTLRGYDKGEIAQTLRSTVHCRELTQNEL